MAADGADSDIKVETIASISEIAAADWDRLAARAGRFRNPFIQHAFLSAIEESGSVGRDTGWTPCHVVLRRGGGMVGVAPFYLKDHSFGEYVFDHGWAEAYMRAGGRYYPKLLCAVPFTPATGPRLLAEDDAAHAALAKALIAVAQSRRISSVHVNFHPETDDLSPQGFLERRGIQYHWFNRGYRTYEDFLGALSSRKRKALRRERREASAGITFTRITGGDLTERCWDAFWRFYQDTGSRKWGRPYLTRSFFSLLGERMAEQVLLVFAERDGRPIAGALNLIGGDTLHGRYWGRSEERPFLHFEVCYHQAIDFAIERGLSRVEAGAQGDHKLARGYEPVLTRSSHWIADQGFRAAVARFLDAERRQVDAELAAIAAESPFREPSPGAR
ncbi:MAG: GNAT family N-acetyltransferase [Parvularculaceae bacterium]